MAIFGEGTAFTLIRCESDAEWLSQRKQGIGGSDVAAIMGLSPWRTPAQVWLEKTGRVEPDDISEKPYVKFGTIMEPLIGKWYADNHPDRIVRRVNAVCRSLTIPCMQASLDYEVKDGDEWGVLEIKTARSAQDWADGVPMYYQTQVIHYLSVTGRRFADVAVFFRDTCEFAEYRLEPDELDRLAVSDAVVVFWLDFVQDDVMPALVGTDGEVANLTELFGKHDDTIFTPEGDDYDTALKAIRLYQCAAAEEKRAKETKTQASATLQGLIGSCKALETDTCRVTWVRGESESFDSKRFRAEHPDLWAQYVTKKPKNSGLRIKELA